MSITPDDIADALEDVQEDRLEELLRDEECFYESLAKRIVTFAAFRGEYKDIERAVIDCVTAVKRHHYALAEKEAQHKDDARRFQASMADSYDGDDYQWRVA